MEKLFFENLQSVIDQANQSIDLIKNDTKKVKKEIAECKEDAYTPVKEFLIKMKETFNSIGIDFEKNEYIKINFDNYDYQADCLFTYAIGYEYESTYLYKVSVNSYGNTEFNRVTKLSPPSHYYKINECREYYNEKEFLTNLVKYWNDIEEELSIKVVNTVTSAMKRKARQAEDELCNNKVELANL